MASNNSSASFGSHGHANMNSGTVQVKIMKSLPPPDEWTMVKEMTMENRAPCEVKFAANYNGS